MKFFPGLRNHELRADIDASRSSEEARWPPTSPRGWRPLYALLGVLALGLVFVLGEVSAAPATWTAPGHGWWPRQARTAATGGRQSHQGPPSVAFDVSLPASSPLCTGRVRVYVKPAGAPGEPRYGCSDAQDTFQVFGLDVQDLGPGDTVRLDSAAATAAADDKEDGLRGYPLDSPGQLPRGVPLQVQAELAVYDLYRRKGLPPTWLPTSCISFSGVNGEYSKPAGTRFSAVANLTLPPAGAEPRAPGQRGDALVHLELSEVEPARADPGCAGRGEGVDTEFIKTVRLSSGRLTWFWGRPMTLEACVLLPVEFYQASRAHAAYPLVLAHGHYSPQFWPGGAFREDDPACDPSVHGYGCVQELYAYYLYKNWTALSSSPFTGARMLVATIRHPVPLFDDSYAVNSASFGPYGDAINYELVPEIEARFRGIGSSWARGVFGGSTGGWESAASLVLYPHVFSYAHAACPDPVTFSKFTSVDIYRQRSAYAYDSLFKRTPTPGFRDRYSGTTWPGSVTPYGDIGATVEEMNKRELALGSRGRSCGQWDIWGAVFSPVGADGFQRRLYNKVTGKIDPAVAQHWREHFDLAHLVRTNWAELAPKLRGKLHIAVGASDTFYLTDAVMDFEAAVKEAARADPNGTGVEIVYGAHEGLGYQHCFRGYEIGADGKPLPNSITRLTYLQALLPKMAASFAAHAPAGADVASWRY